MCEDQEIVRAVTALILRGAGYTVLEAADGRFAQELADEHPGAIDLLVTDVIMPRMNGRELAAILGPRYPKMRTLFVSGYAIDVVGGHCDQEQLLHKPFTPDVLLQRVRRLLDEEQPMEKSHPEACAELSGE